MIYRKIALELAVATFSHVSDDIHRNHGNWVIDVAKQYEAFLNTSTVNSDIETAHFDLALAHYDLALYQSDVERIWAMMPELRDTDSQYTIFEAVEAKIELLRGLAK